MNATTLNAPAADAAQQRAELDVLRQVTGFERRCFYNRFFAIRSLALRSPETIDFWVGLYRGEEDAWQRAQLVRIGFARFDGIVTGRLVDAAVERGVGILVGERLGDGVRVPQKLTVRLFRDL